MQQGPTRVDIGYGDRQSAVEKQVDKSIHLRGLITVDVADVESGREGRRGREGEGLEFGGTVNHG